MKRTWSRPVNTPPDGLDYWDYFGHMLVDLAAISPASKILDVGCGTGPSLFPAAERTGTHGYVIGIDICPS